jgi:hypothetical protein
MVLIMGNKTLKAVLCLLVLAAVFISIGCAGRDASKNDQGSAATSTPTPAPAVTNPAAAAPTVPPTATPTPAVPPGDAGTGQSNYTTTLCLDDVLFSGGDEQYEFSEDALPTPSAE